MFFMASAFLDSLPPLYITSDSLQWVYSFLFLLHSILLLIFFNESIPFSTLESLLLLLSPGLSASPSSTLKSQIISGFTFNVSSFLILFAVSTPSLSIQCFSIFFSLSSISLSLHIASNPTLNSLHYIFPAFPILPSSFVIPTSTMSSYQIQLTCCTTYSTYKPFPVKSPLLLNLSSPKLSSCITLKMTQSYISFLTLCSLTSLIFFHLPLLNRA